MITDIQYNAMGQVTQITYGNGTVKEYAYDPVMSRLMNMKVTNGYSAVIQDLEKETVGARLQIGTGSK